MTRYAAFSAPHGWTVMDTANDCRAPISQYIEEAEARIIAFALNVVAAGEILGSRTHPFEWYNGPTEGVAPHG